MKTSPELRSATFPAGKVSNLPAIAAADREKLSVPWTVLIPSEKEIASGEWDRARQRLIDSGALIHVEKTPSASRVLIRECSELNGGKIPPTYDEWESLCAELGVAHLTANPNWSPLSIWPTVRGALRRRNREKAHAPAKVEPTTDDAGRFSAAEIAAKYDLPHDATRKALERWRADDGEGVIDNLDQGAKEPRYLYPLSAPVVAIITALQKRQTRNAIRRTKTSIIRPTKKSDASIPTGK